MCNKVRRSLARAKFTCAENFHTRHTHPTSSLQAIRSDFTIHKQTKPLSNFVTGTSQHNKHPTEDRRQPSPCPPRSTRSLRVCKKSDSCSLTPLPPHPQLTILAAQNCRRTILR